MKSRKLVAFAAACAAALSMVVAFSAASAGAQTRSAAAMAAAANTFLASLTPEQKAKATLRFDAEERFNWDESPRPRKGIPLKELTDQQRTLAMELWKTGVGETGYQKIQTIRSREPVLSALQQTEEGRRMRDPDLYYFSIFDTPSTKSTWGWRVEGHHMSLNFTVVRGELISNAPLFLGAQPADLTAAGLKGPAAEAAARIPPALAARALAGEEDRARELVQSLDAKQRAIAIFDRPEKRTADMLSGINNKKTTPLSPPGLLARQMTKEQKALLVKVVEEYLSRMPPDVAADRSRKLLSGSNLDDIAFSWVGGTERGQAHNYVVQGPTFMIEYAQSRNNATGHIHTIWRDFNDDFGVGLLSRR